MRLEPGQVALVTGTSRGLGVFIARALAERGLRLVLTARSAESLEAVARDLGHDETLCLPADVTDAAARESLVKAAEARFGAIDVLVNNAGLAETVSFERTDLAHLDRAIALNLTAPMHLTQLVLPGMLARGRGHVVNIASIAGVLGSPYHEAYCATKHGLVGFTRSFRATAQDKSWPVSASVICPGYMDGAGIYEGMKRDHGVRAPALLGSLDASLLGRAVITAVESDSPDLLLMSGGPRLSTAANALFPRLVERVAKALDLHSTLREVSRR